MAQAIIPGHSFPLWRSQPINLFQHHSYPVKERKDLRRDRQRSGCLKAAAFFARKNGLTFIHDKVLVARAHFENPGGYENRIYYLCFKDSGQPYIRKEIFTPGISAGSCMGGEFNEDLPMDFIRKWNLRHKR